MKKKLVKIQEKMQKYRDKLDDIMKRIDENTDISEVNKADFRAQIVTGQASIVKPLTKENLDRIKSDQESQGLHNLSR